jgi:DNA topoisomerase IB
VKSGGTRQLRRSDPGAVGIRRRRCGRGRDKHDRIRDLGAALPHLREVVGRHLAGRGLTRDRVLAAAVRLIDLGFFRPGGEEYAEENGTFGLATLLINDYIREVSGGDYTAKDFRTWHATVLAAVGLAVSERADTDAARKRAVARVVREVAGYLGNTPAVARASYIDPRVIRLYENGRTIAAVLGDLGQDSDFGDLATRGRAEGAVLKLLADPA